MISLGDNGGNLHLTSPAAGVQFDIDADGILEQVAWTPSDSEVAFLAHDRNDNQRIDSGSELLGEAMKKSNGERALNGFDALLDLDGGADRSDGWIDPADAAYSRLRLWLDRNHNGLSEPSELLSLAAAGIVRIGTAYRESPRIDRNGNAYRYVGQAIVRKNQRLLARRVFDVVLTVASAPQDRGGCAITPRPNTLIPFPK